MKTFKVFYIFIFIEIKLTIEKIDYFEYANTYQNELCSYNGIPSYDSKTNQVICECDEKHVNEPRVSERRYINGHLVQCSYEKKKRFYAFFLAAIFPIGLDFVYLGHVHLFLLSLALFIIVIACNIIQLILDYKQNSQMEEKANQQNSKVKHKFMIRNTEINFKRINIFGINIIFIIYYASHIIIQALGYIKDSNNIETENDMGYLFSSPEK
jgi:hypothetical protein